MPKEGCPFKQKVKNSKFVQNCNKGRKENLNLNSGGRAPAVFSN